MTWRTAKNDKEIDNWIREVNEAVAKISDEDHERMAAALAEIERESKDPEMLRREWEKLEALFREIDCANDTKPVAE